MTVLSSGVNSQPGDVKCVHHCQTRSQCGNSEIIRGKTVMRQKRENSAEVKRLTAQVRKRERSGECVLTACGTGMLISDSASEKRCCRRHCCCSPCAQEGALNVEEERKRGKEGWDGGTGCIGFMRGRLDGLTAKGWFTARLSYRRYTAVQKHRAAWVNVGCMKFYMWSVCHAVT